MPGFFVTSLCNTKPLRKVWSSLVLQRAWLLWLQAK